MAEIRPLRGIRYNTRISGSLREVVSPPYDVVGRSEQEEICTRSEFNIMRLLRRRTGSRPYREAGVEFGRWLRSGALFRDEVPAIYVYEQEYGAKRRRGYTALVRLADLDEGVILPHEDTMETHLQDRFELMKEVHANLSSVFGLFEDDGGVQGMSDDVVHRQPDMEFVDYDDLTHRVWLMSDPDMVRQLVRAMAQKPIIIADGHHRYKAALRYRDWRRCCRPSSALNPSHDYILMTFIPLDSPGVEILPTHRLISGLDPSKVDALFSLMQRDFQLVASPVKIPAAISTMGNIGARGGVAIGAYTRKSGASVFRLRRRTEELDVDVLEGTVLRDMLGLGKGSPHREAKVSFSHDAETACASVEDGDYDVAFLLNPTPVATVRDQALARRIMPEKSTYFYPKLVAGLIMNVL